MSRHAAKRKKKEKRRAQDLRNLTSSELIDRGKAALAGGKAREAVPLFRQARKQMADPEGVKVYLYQAYRLREAQLREKAMTAEADAMLTLAMDNRPSGQKIPPEELPALIRGLPYAEALVFYSDHLRAGEPVKEIDRMLAGRLVAGDGREGLLGNLERLPEALPWKAQALALKPAIGLMNRSEWAEALAAMEQVSRTSPFADLRLFCRAMAAFYNNDQATIQKAAAMISEAFPLKQVALALEIENPAQEMLPPAIKKILPLLWQGPFDLEAEVDALIRRLRQPNRESIKPNILALARVIYPGRPDMVLPYLMEMLASTRNDGVSDAFYNQMVKSILPQDQAETVLAKKNLRSSACDLEGTGRYLDRLTREIPDPGDAKMAEALVLSDLVGRIVKYRMEFQQEFRGSSWQRYRGRLGISSAEPQEAVIEILARAVSLDPDCKGYYRQMAELPRRSRPARNKVEAALLTMKDRFVDDPYPCIELSTLYHEKKAYRKAETILEEAARRAPADSRVMDRRVLSLLIAADRSYGRGNMDLARRDIEKAVESQTPRTAWLVEEKRLLIRLAGDRETAEPWLHEAVAARPPAEQLKIAAVLMLDAERRIARHSKACLEIIALLQSLLRNTDTLNSKEIMSLLSPLPAEFRFVLPTSQVVPVFITHGRDLLKGLTDQDLLSLIDRILAAEPAFPLFKDLAQLLKQRVETLDDPLLSIYRLYMTFLAYLTEGFMDYEFMQRLFDDADSLTLQRLKDTSRRLARYAEGPAAAAMENFNFHHWLEPFHDAGDDYPDDDDDDDDFFDDFSNMPGDDDLLEEMVLKLPRMFIDMIENVIDENGLRGASSRELRRFASAGLSNLPEVQMLVPLLKLQCQEGLLPGISKETRIIINAL